MVDRVDCVVIGAGVIGLAVARAMALSGRETVVLEAGRTIGMGTSSRNSEVIHAGIYYPRDSLKARLCVEGRMQLYQYCKHRGVPFRDCGKLLVATDSAQIPALAALDTAARANGVQRLRWLTAAEARAMEPELQCVAALWSPDTGIVDSHTLMVSLLGDFERAGGRLACASPVRRGSCGNGLRFEVGDNPATELAASIAVNCAGLGAQALARSLEGLPVSSVPALYLAKGSYYSVSGRPPFARLVYPIPQDGGLGVHFTMDLRGQARFGPDVEWVDSVDYDVNPARAEAFYAGIRRYWPGLPDDALRPAYAGIRPKLQAPGGPTQDFLIQGPRDHGIRGLVNLYGIESPGLTAALAIGDHVAQLV